MVVIIFGVSGAGKTTIGKLLARQLGWDFFDADDFHSKANIDKMRKGIALTDADRAPWLSNLRTKIEEILQSQHHAVMACSALKAAYRRQLRVNDAVRFVFLRGEKKLVQEQLEHRTGDFIDHGLLESQFATLEQPTSDENVVTISLGREPDELVREIKQTLQRAG